MNDDEGWTNLYRGGKGKGGGSALSLLGVPPQTVDDCGVGLL